MIINYLKIARRNLFKNKLLSILNIVCLAIGMASVLIIINYLKFEWSYDRFYKDTERIFRVEYCAQIENDWWTGMTYHTGPFAPTIKATYPEITHFTRIHENGMPRLISYNEEKHYVNSYGAHWVDSGFLDIFECKILKGDKKNA